MVRTIPSSILSMAKPGQTITQTTPGGGKQTIVIAAPKQGGQGQGQGQKIITTIPKTQAGAGGAGTQYIVVTTRPGAQQGE
jgi:hypothetical protein